MKCAICEDILDGDEWMDSHEISKDTICADCATEHPVGAAILGNLDELEGLERRLKK